MRLAVAALLLSGCATVPVEMVAPIAALQWPEGWAGCGDSVSAPYRQRSFLAARAPCDLGQARCRFLREALGDCRRHFGGRLVALVDTDDDGRITARCLAAHERPPTPEALGCIGRAFDVVGAGSTPGLRASPLTITLEEGSSYLYDAFTLGPDDVVAAVMAERGRVTACLDAQRRADLSRAGKVTFAWVFTAEGKATDVELRSPEFSGTVVAACLEQVVRSLTVRPRPGGDEKVVYPFKL